MDGLVAAMAHLWSKFTKCLRPSKGAFNPGLYHPRTLRPSSVQCRVIRYYYVVAITASRRSNEVHPLFIYPFILRSTHPSFLYRAQIRVSLFCNLPNKPRASALIMLITKYRARRDYRSSGDAMCRSLFMEISRWKIPDTKLIAVR